MSKPLGDRVKVTLRLPTHLHARINDLADRAGQPLNTFILRTLANQLDSAPIGGAAHAPASIESED
jgi:predicted HicB family RNase H-like nuclease